METWDTIRARRNVRQCVYLIGLGYPADRPLRPLARPDRRPFQDVVHWNHW